MRRPSERVLISTGLWEHLGSHEVFRHGETTITGPLYVRVYASLDERPWHEDFRAITAWVGEQGFRCDLVPCAWSEDNASCLVVRLFRRTHEAIFRLTF